MEDRTIKKLDRLCDKEVPRLASPFGYVREGVRYIGATDGHLAVILRSETELPALPFDFGKIFEGYTLGQPVALKALRKFAGPAIFDRQCGKCKGKGHCVHCEAYCERCEGSGVLDAERRPSRINDVWLNCNLLARALQVVPPVQSCHLSLPDDYETGKSQKRPQCKPIFVTSSEWIIAVMPMAMNVEAKDAPVFTLQTADSAEGK